MIKVYNRNNFIIIEGFDLHPYPIKDLKAELSNGRISIVRSNGESKLLKEFEFSQFQDFDGNQLGDDLQSTIDALKKIFDTELPSNSFEGYAVYGDNQTAATPILLEPDVWTNITVDSQNQNVNYENDLPVTIDRLWDEVDNKIDLTDTPVGAMLAIEIQVFITPSVNHVEVDTRLNSVGVFTKDKFSGTLDNGSGKEYSITENFRFYVGSEFVRQQDLVIQARASAMSNMRVTGVLVEVI